MKPQKVIAVIMLLLSSVLMAVASQDIAYPAILCILGLLGLQRRLTWDIKPNHRVIKSWLLLLLAILFALHYSLIPSRWMGHEQIVALAWQTVARYFLACMVVLLFLGSPRQLPPSFGLFHIAITICTGQILLLDDLLLPVRLLELLSVILTILYAMTALPDWRLQTADCGFGILGGRAEARGESAIGNPQSAICSPSLLHGGSYWPAAVGILVVAANAGWILGSVLYQHVEVLNYIPVWLARQTMLMEQAGSNVWMVGFNTSGRLSSMATVLQDQDATVALTIDCRNSPGYLRARAFDHYRQSEWQSGSMQEEVAPAQNNPVSLYLGGRTNTFWITDSDYPDLEYMTIRHEWSFRGPTFTPPGTVTVEAPLYALRFDDDGIVYASTLPGGRGYRVGYTNRAFRTEPTGSHLHRMLTLPPSLDPRVLKLAERIFAGRTTTSEKIDAVVNHFRSHYAYSLYVDIPEDQDKLTYFLLSGSSGYCEYFASGAAILLRIAGVPTRYVTGFFVTQRGDSPESWIARNMDAHAWAEAWDEQRHTWAVVEATVEGGANTNSTAAASEQGGAGMGARLKQLLEALYQYGLLGLVSWLFTSYGLFTSSLLLSTLLAATLWWGLIHLWFGHSLHHPADPSQSRRQSSRVLAMHRMLGRIDRKAKTLGYVRRLDETLYGFAQRIAVGDPKQRNNRLRGAPQKTSSALWTAMAQWYLLYADRRYGKDVGPEELQDLRRAARALQVRL